ncbi:glycoside hydrolase [Globomyces pollinis-pini]|nr:glycoside hydrolase [Globomyces pollinis-pini]
MLIQFLVCIWSVIGVSLNADDSKEVLAATKQVAARLMSYYTPQTSTLGSIHPKDDPSAKGYQWFEGGIMWGAMMEYQRYTGDDQYKTTVTNALTLASYGKIASFLGSDRNLPIILGRWNDDMLWWGLGAMMGAELYPSNTIMPGGVSYTQLAMNTYDDVWNDWEEKNCQFNPGGIYWSKDRQDAKRKDVKSAITHGQQVMMGARLSIMNRNQTYLDHADKIVQWLKKGLIDQNNFTIYDNIVSGSPDQCAIEYSVHSYNAGMIASSLAFLSKATGKDEYMALSENIVGAGLKVFTSKSILIDQCELTPKDTCELNKVTPKGIFIRGISDVYTMTKNETLKSQIKTALVTSMNALTPFCDDQWNCNSNAWVNGVSTTKNVHLQLNSLELFNALLKVHNTASTTVFAPPISTPPPDSVTGPVGGATNVQSVLSMISVAAVFLLL